MNNASHENRHEIRPAQPSATSPGDTADAAPADPAAPPGGVAPAARAARRTVPRALVAAVLAGGAAVSVAAQDEGVRHPVPEAAPPVQRAYAARPVAVGASTRGVTRRRTRAQGPAALGHGMVFPGRRRAGAHPGAVTGAEASRLLGVRSAPAVRAVPGPFAGPVDGPGGAQGDAPAAAPAAPQAPDGGLLGRLNGALGGELGDLGGGPLFGGPGGSAAGGDQGGPAPDPAPEQQSDPGPAEDADPGGPTGADDQGPASPAPGTPSPVPDANAPAPQPAPPATPGPSAPPATPATPAAPSAPAAPATPAPHRPAHHAAAPSGADKLDWDGLAQCEAGGRPDAVDPSGRYGGLYQFDAHTWHSLGGSGLPQDAPADRQTALAKKLYQRRGASPWPSCGRRLYR